MITPLSVIPAPPLIERSPFAVNVPMLRALVPLSIVTFPEVPCVDADTAPVKELLVVLKVILLFEPVEVKLDVPLTVNAAD